MRQSFCLSWLLVAGLVLAPACARQSRALETAHVYKPDGTHHCDANPGVSLDAAVRELLDNGIRVYDRRKSHDGREGIAVCGEPTGGINVFEIAKSDLSRAVQLGFQPLDPSWLETAPRRGSGER